MEFTEEQQRYIDKLIEDKTKGLYTEDELNRRVTAEVDRRVESGIQKGLETYRSKWEEEFARKAQMTAEEKAQEELESKIKELADREKEIERKSNTINAMDILSNAGIPKDHYERFIPMLVTDDSELTQDNVQNFIDTFNETKSQLEKSIKEQYSNVPKPGTGESETVTKEDFSKMGYSEKLKFKETNPDLYKEYIK